MKFHQLEIGRWFELQGERYLKTSPLMARLEGASRDQIVPRSREIRPVAGEPEAFNTTTGVMVPVGEVARSIKHWRLHCAARIADLPDPPDRETLPAIENILLQAEQGILADLVEHTEVDLHD